MKRCIKPDIVIIDPLMPELYVIAELKFFPIYWGYMPLYLATKKELENDAIEELKDAIKKDLSYFERAQQEKLTQQEIERRYFGVDKQGRTKIEKLISIINDFEKKEGKIGAGYLCVIDEIYPNVREILQEAIEKF